MAIHTLLTDTTLQTVAQTWALGPLLGAEPLAKGGMATNYRLRTRQGLFFLRHTTTRDAEDLAFEAALLSHLHLHHLAVPTLLPTAGGAPWLEVQGGRVSLFGWLAGEEVPKAALTPAHLEALGALLGRVHRATESFAAERPNPYGLPVVRTWLEALVEHPEEALRTGAREMLGVLGEVEAHPPELEPLGVIHGDLFPDNVKWLGERLSALLDFEMACHAPYGLDLAITLDAWCFDAGAWRPELAQALLRGYGQEHPLPEQMRRALYAHARFAAVRFATSRIRDYYLSPLPPDRLVRKDWRTWLARARTLQSMGEEGFRQLVGLP